MSSQTSFVDYIVDQLSGLKNIRILKMFGEYGLYCDEKVVILICDDKVFLKKTEIGEKLIKGRFEYAPAYPGAKPSLLIGVDVFEDRELFSALVASTADALPMPKPKRRKLKR
jgi:TfoX/Sxy family transcriptional regulator of competence genes